jgi:hypothetical protein
MAVELPLPETQRVSREVDRCTFSVDAILFSGLMVSQSGRGAYGATRLSGDQPR